MAASDIGNWLNLIAFGGAELQGVFTASGALNPSPLSQIVPFDTTARAFTIGTPTRSVPGQKIAFIDVGGTATVTHSLSISDPNGYEFQDPDNPDTFSNPFVLSQTRNLTFVLVEASDSTRFWATP